MTRDLDSLATGQGQIKQHSCHGDFRLIVQALESVAAVAAAAQIQALTGLVADPALQGICTECRRPGWVD
jgi:hypothetical protein